MIENFIQITDLTIKESRLLEWLSNTTTLNNHIEDGFKRTIIELTKRNIDTRLIMVPLYLCQDISLNSSYTGDWVEAQRKNRVRRFVIKKLTSINDGDNYFILEGSNDKNTVKNILSIKLTNDSGTLTQTFNEEYKYYRFRLEVDTSVEFTGSLYLVETSFDDLIIFKSLQKIFTSLTRKEDDNFAVKMRLYEKEFYDELANLSYSYDINESGTIEENETIRKLTSVRISL